MMSNQQNELVFADEMSGWQEEAEPEFIKPENHNKFVFNN